MKLTKLERNFRPDVSATFAAADKYISDCNSGESCIEDRPIFPSEDPALKELPSLRRHRRKRISSGEIVDSSDEEGGYLMTKVSSVLELMIHLPWPVKCFFF